MSRIIVAYDGTPQAEDALTLGVSLSNLTGFALGIAHVHRADPRLRAPSASGPGREAFLERQSEALLERAVDSLPAGSPEVSTHALAGSTTATALRSFAEREGVEVIVFGSAHNGPSGRVHPGSAARRLLHSASCAIAVAPEGLRNAGPAKPTQIAYASDDERGSARTSAEALAAAAGAKVAEGADQGAELLLVGSRPGGPQGQVTTAASSERIVQASTSPVLVLAYGEPLHLAGAAVGSQAA